MMVFALTVDSAVRDSVLGEVMNCLSVVVPANAGPIATGVDRLQKASDRSF
jgi:hypothetical protein